MRKSFLLSYVCFPKSTKNNIKKNSFFIFDFIIKNIKENL